MKPYTIGVGRRIKALRIAKGIAQREFASRLHVDVRSITNWEAGRHAPEPAIREKLALVLGASVAEIFLERDDHLSIARARALTKSIEILNKPNTSAAEINAATNTLVRAKDRPEEKSVSAREEEHLQEMQTARDEFFRKLARIRETSDTP